MAKTTLLQSSFVSGELSPLLLGRTDLQQYAQGVETGENVMIVPQGGLKRRCGTEHIDTPVGILTPYTSGITATMPNGGTPANLNDFNPATYGTTTTPIGTTGVGGSTYVVASYDMSGVSGNIRFVDLQNIRLVIQNSDTAVFRVQVSSDGTNWDAGVPVTLTSNYQSFRIKIESNIATPYVRLVRFGDSGDLGSQTVELSELNVMQETTDTSDVKTFDFSVEVDRHYLCVATGGAETTPSYGNMAFYRIPHAGSTDTVLVANMRLPYKASEIATVRDAQTERVMLMFHEEHPPQRIINTADLFEVDDVPFVNVPQYDYDDLSSPTPVSDVQDMVLSGFQVGDTFQIDIEGVLSKNITFAGDITADQRSSTVFNLQKNIQEMPVMAEDGVTVSRTGAHTYRITCSGASAKDFELFTGFQTSGSTGALRTITTTKVANGSTRKENIWSATRGYPRMGTFHGGRLWLGGTKSKTQSLFASRSGSFFDFFIEEGLADEGIFVTLTARTQTEIVDINSDRGLQIFTTGLESLVKGNSPTDIDVVSQTQHGASYLEVKSLDGATLFVDRNGKTLRQYVYNFNEDAYTSNDISVLSSHLINKPKDMAVLSGTSSDDANWVFIINEDGTGAVLNTLRSQDINGFTKWVNADSGRFIAGSPLPYLLVSASVVNNELYMVNKVTGGTSFNYSIERWSFDYLLDSAVKLTNISNTGVTLPDSHLNNAEVSVIANGNNLAKRTVSSLGVLTLTAEELSGGAVDLEIGLNFVPTVVPMPLNTNMGSGFNVMRQKKITNMNLRVYQSGGIYIDGNPVPVRNFGDSSDSPLGTPFKVKSGIIENNNGGNGWGINVAPRITVPDAAPFHLQAIQFEVESS
jgi:hypothetical protein